MAAKIPVVQPRRAQSRGNSPHHRDAEVDLADRRLQAVHNVAGRFQLAKTSDGGDEIELDAGQQLSELVVQLARNTCPFFLAHLLDTLRQRCIELDRGQGELQGMHL